MKQYCKMNEYLPASEREICIINITTHITKNIFVCAIIVDKEAKIPY